MDDQSLDLRISLADPASPHVVICEWLCMIQEGSLWSARSFKPAEASFRRRGGVRKEAQVGRVRSSAMVWFQA